MHEIFLWSQIVPPPKNCCIIIATPVANYCSIYIHTNSNTPRSILKLIQSQVLFQVYSYSKSYVLYSFYFCSFIFMVYFWSIPILYQKLLFAFLKFFKIFLTFFNFFVAIIVNLCFKLFIVNYFDRIKLWKLHHTTFYLLRMMN